MPYDDRSSFTLWEVTEKRNPKEPDYRGIAYDQNGNKFRLAGWFRDTKTGRALKGQLETEQQYNQRAGNPAQPGRGGPPRPYQARTSTANPPRQVIEQAERAMQPKSDPLVRAKNPANGTWYELPESMARQYKFVLENEDYDQDVPIPVQAPGDVAPWDR